MTSGQARLTFDGLPEELAGAVRGEVLAADADGFDDAVRAHNPALQHDAAVVVVAADASDVGTAVTIARRHSAGADAGERARPVASDRARSARPDEPDEQRRGRRA